MQAPAHLFTLVSRAELGVGCLEAVLCVVGWPKWLVLHFNHGY